MLSKVDPVCLPRLTLEVIDLEACEVLRILVLIAPAAGAALACVVAVAQVQPELAVAIPRVWSVA